ncbi:hypothetical protein TREES_T100003904 [Tupaia chinensis]|uniref:Uncharacterized protein n=1 Tax=Tupaia chinensis TaxID=246437 RepID=L9L031_TUPCH|nr:hypothetical protein TREES_T100003904 [Tupaia chinensis]
MGQTVGPWSPGAIGSVPSLLLPRDPIDRINGRAAQGWFVPVHTSPGKNARAFISSRIHQENLKDFMVHTFQTHRSVEVTPAPANTSLSTQMTCFPTYHVVLTQPVMPGI